MCVCVSADMSKQSQSTVKYFLGYLPSGPERNEWVSSCRDGEKREGRREERGETEEGGGSNKDEGVQLADSGQSTRTPTSEWAQEERRWAEEREERSERRGEVEEGTVKLRGGDKQEARGIKEQKDHGRNVSKNVQELGANF